MFAFNLQGVVFDSLVVYVVLCLFIFELVFVGSLSIEALLAKTY